MRKCVYCLLVQECIIRLVVGQLRRRRQMMMEYSSSYHTHHHGDSILRRRASYERRYTLSSENSTYACPLHRVFVHVQPRLLLFPHARMHHAVPIMCRSGLYKYWSMSGLMLSGDEVGAYRFATLPCLSMRNLPKFHLILSRPESPKVEVSPFIHL